MDKDNATSHTLRIADLEAKLVQKDAEVAVLAREIQSPHTSPERKREAIAHRDSILLELRSIYADLLKLRQNSS